MKILIYEGSAGFTSYTYRLCNALCEVSDDVDISYITAEKNEEIHELNKRINLFPVLKDYSKAKVNSLAWYINRIYISMSNILKRNRLIRKGEYEVVFIQFTIPIIDQFFIKKIGSKMIYTAHDVIPPNKSRFWSIKSLNCIYNSVSKIVVHTEGNKKQLIESFNIPEDKITVIHHGMETCYKELGKTECLRSLGIDSGFDLVMLFYGSIREQKGLDDLLSALAGIDNVHLIIAGAMPHGESFSKYEEIIDKNGLSVTKMIEYVPYEMTDILFQACDVVCLPYKYFYSQSGVFMQAIQYRKPVIVSDVSSFGEYIAKYDMGILSNPNDAKDLHNKILKMKSLLEGKTNIFAEGLETATKENSWYESAIKHMELFEDWRSKNDR